MVKTTVKTSYENGLYVKKYDTYKSRCSKDLMIALISDLHFCDEVKAASLIPLTQNIASYQPDIICFGGDLVNDAKTIMNNDRYKALIEWFNILTKIAPVYIIKGNHDLLTRNPDGKGWKYYNNEKLFNDIANIDGVHLLSGENTKENFEDIAITGFDLGESTEYHYEENRESVESFTNDVYPILSSQSLYPDQFNLLLFHSPENLYKLQLDAYSLILSGHMHNGAIPNCLDRFLPTNRGLISPTNVIAPTKSRGKTDLSEETTGIIASPITIAASLSNNGLARKLYKPGTQYIHVHKREK